MKVSLRKAKALQTSIQSAISDLEISNTTVVSIFQDPEAKIKEASSKFDEDMTRQANLLTTLYAIRGAVGKANAESGIDMALTALALISKTLELKERFAKSPVQWEPQVIKGKIEKIKQSDPKFDYTDDSVMAPVLTQRQIGSLKTDITAMKKKQQALSDSVLDLNSRTEITLSNDVVAVLQSENLI